MAQLLLQCQEMPTSEKFCLKWNDFQGNINNSYAALRKDSDFTDATLVCQDGQQIEAHKVILAASSPFFQNLLKRNKHAHPLIYMKGMNTEDLLAIVDFFYYGEANIYQENLNSFLNIAEELKLKGLHGREEGGGEGKGNSEIPRQICQPILPSPFAHKKNGTFETKLFSQEYSFLPQSYSDDQETSSGEVVVPKQRFPGDMKELDEQIEVMIGRGENMLKGNGKGCMVKAYVCQACGKEGNRTNIMDHIEVNHFEGLSFPCNLCEKSCPSRKALRYHIQRSHTNSDSLGPDMA